MTESIMNGSSLHGFILLERERVSGTRDWFDILQRSAHANKTAIEVKRVIDRHTQIWRCTVKIAHQVMAEATGSTAVVAREKAGLKSLELMRTHCWTILEKDYEEKTVISRDDIINMGTENERTREIQSSNVGHKMLCKMGWSGGGLGKHGTGMEKPVTADSVVNRGGIGSAFHKFQSLLDSLKRILKQYAASRDFKRLVFSTEFEKNEREIIHSECLKLNLISKSRGKDDDRCLRVSKKICVNTLFQYLMSVGGETEEFLLVRPGGRLTMSPSPPLSQPLLSQEPQPSALTPCIQEKEEQGQKGTGMCSMCEDGRRVISSLESRCAELERRLSLFEADKEERELSQDSSNTEIEKKKTKKNKKKKEEAVSPTDEADDVEEQQIEYTVKKKKKKRKVEEVVPPTDEAGDGEDQQIEVKEARKKKRKKVEEAIPPTDEAEALEDQQIEVKERRKKKKKKVEEAVPPPVDADDVEDQQIEVKEGKKKKKKKVEEAVPPPDEAEDVEDQQIEKTERRKKKKKRKLEEAVPSNEEDVNDEQEKTKRLKRKTKRKALKETLEVPAVETEKDQQSKLNSIVDGGEDDLQALRGDNESNKEWQLRWDFLQHNKSSLPMARLVSLSHCLVQMAVYGCSYPPAVMALVRERSNGVLEQIENARQEMAQ